MVYRKNIILSKLQGAGASMTNKASSRNSRKVISNLKLTAIAAAALATSSNLAALGLGALDVQSNLDQPLNGVIELRIADGDDVSSLEALIASAEDFASLGIDYPSYMDSIQLTMEDVGGDKILRVNSAEIIINEPFIHFLVRINWAGGSFLREYTALIDPPIYAAETPKTLAEPKVVGTDESYQVEEAAEIEVEDLDYSVDESEVVDEISDAESVYEEEAYTEDVEAAAEDLVEEAAPEEDSLPIEEDVSIEEEVAEDSYSDEPVDEQPAEELASDQFPSDARYGPVVSGESLSVIAQELQQQFPDLSIYQIMRVLFDENRSAFIRENINGLMKGAVLNLGDLNAIRAVDIAEAKSFFYQQISDWDPSALVASDSSSSDGLRVGQDEYGFDDGSLSDSSGYQSDSAQTQDTFQVGASTDSQTYVSATEGDNREGEVIALQQQITDMESALSSSSLENQELTERISMLEGQLADMNRLLSLNVEDAEMASIESTLAGQNNAEDDLGQQDDTLLADDSMMQADEVGLDQEFTGDELVDTYDDAAAQVEDTFGIDDPSLMDGSVDEFIDGSYDGANELVDSSLVDIGDGSLETADQDSLDAALNDELLADEVSNVDAAAPAAISSGGPSLMEKLKTIIVDNGLWKIIAGIAGVLLAGMAAIIFRRRRADEEFEISMLSIETQSQSTTEDSKGADSKDSEDLTGDRETSFLTVYSDSDAVVQADEVDPIAEADVYIAYGRDEQAEEVLLDGIAGKPGRVDIKQKLLGLYHKNNNVEGFERIAEELYSQKSSLTTDIWQQVSLMGKDIAPKNPLFAVSAAELLTEGDEVAEQPESAVNDQINLHNEVEEVTIEDPSEAIDMALAEGDESINLINFDDGRSEVSELDRVEIDALDLDDEEAIDNDYRDDFNSPALDKGVGNENSDDEVSEEVLVTVLADDVLDEDVELDDVVGLNDSPEVSDAATDSSNLVDAAAALGLDESDDQDDQTINYSEVSVDDESDDGLMPISENTGMMDFETVDDTVSLESSDIDIQLIDTATMTHEVSGLEIDDQYDEAKTQFELAKVFVDLGDQEGARKILDEIIAAGDENDDVVEDAIELLDSFDS